jgi:carbon storage regulator
VLILSRKVGEKILTGDDIVVTVVSVKGDNVKIGIDAPDAVAITRPDAQVRRRQRASKESKEK